jgi:Uma2 family endonuclease
MTSAAKLTYEDYVKLPEDGLCREIIGGEHIVSAAPIPRHQILRGEIYIALRRLQDAGRAQILFSPIDLRLSEIDVVQPDLVAIAKGSESIFGPTRIEGPPEPVVEIISAATARVDRGRKLELYARLGVQEYWIVDDGARTLTKHALVASRYQVHHYHDVPVPSSVRAPTRIECVPR